MLYFQLKFKSFYLISIFKWKKVIIIHLKDKFIIQ